MEQELAFFRLPCSGMTYAQVAGGNARAIQAVDGMETLYRKLNVVNWVELKLYTAREGINRE